MPRGSGRRDPRSVDWDDAARSVLISAIRAMRQRKGVIVWVASPRRQFRDKDAGGLTAEERAFSRAMYYPVWSVPNRMGVPQQYTLKLTWGETLEPSSHGRMAHACQVRLYPKGKAKPRSKADVSWADEMAATGDSSFQPPRTGPIGRPKPPPTVRS